MTRTEISVVATCGVLAAVSVFSAWEARRAASALLALEERVVRLEAASSPRPLGAADPEVTREIAVLGQRIASLEAMSRRLAGGAATESTLPTTSNPGSVDGSEEARARVWAASTAKRVCGGLASSLALSGQQSADVERVLIALLEDFRRARKGNSADLAAKAGEVLKAQTIAQVKPLLTPQQQESFDRIASSEQGVFSPVPGEQDSPWGVTTNPMRPTGK